MRTTLLALSGLAVAVTAAPGEARHYSNVVKCTKHRHGKCVRWNRLTRGQAERAGFAVGHEFGPNYSYVETSALPQPVVTRYHLGSNFRYVDENGYVYVVSPDTYRVVRVIRIP